jgi:DNA-binding CsgD family transcriptional regulator
MAKTDLLRLRDVRDAYRLIGECRDLGNDPALWHRRMFEGLCRLIGATSANGGEGRWLRPHRPVEPLSAFRSGPPPVNGDRLATYMRERAHAIDPVWQALQRVPGRLVARTRRQLVSDATWYRSAVFNDYLRPAHVDHRLTSVYDVSDAGNISAITLNRSSGERDFSPREQQQLSFFHGEIGRLIGRSLVSVTEPSPDKLSPRLRQTLACLLEGDSEKQAAKRLGVSYETVHEYVTALYRHFGVHSRPQLLSHVFRRKGQRPWTEMPEACDGDDRRPPA